MLELRYTTVGVVVTVDPVEVTLTTLEVAVPLVVAPPCDCVVLGDADVATKRGGVDAAPAADCAC
jgi:hypothetical protein